MSRLSRSFKALKKQNRAALITYFMAGYPDAGTSLSLIAAAAAEGADIIEVGIPFSDPVADGRVIEHAGEAAMAGGMTPDGALELISLARKTTEVPLVIMTYYNVILRQGVAAFADKAARAGADGVIIPDLPPEEGAEWIEAARASGLETVFLIAPTSTDSRIRAAAKASSGFVYCVSLLGVTGSGKGPGEGLADFIARARGLTKKPLAIGFGISTPAQAAAAGEIADGVIVGSALLEKISGENNQRDVARAAEFTRELAVAISGSIDHN